MYRNLQKGDDYMCLGGRPKIQAPEPIAPTARPMGATKSEVDSDDVFRKLRKKKGTSFLTRAQERGSSLLSASNENNESKKSTLG